MRTTTSERIHAERVSAAVDELMGDPEARLAHLDAEEAGLLEAARRLAQLPALLGPVAPALEQRVTGQVQKGASARRRRRLPGSRPVWAMAGAVVTLLAVMFLTPLGQTAVASFMAVFNLGRTEVRITPVDVGSAPLATAAAGSTAVQESLTLAQARAQVSFAIPQPAYLPPGYGWREVIGYSFPDLPPWVPQPFFVELVYEDGQGGEIALRIYPITLGDQASISGLNLGAAPIQDVQDVDVDGQPGVLLRLGTREIGAAWQEVVWEQGDLILALSATDLTEAELLRVARSVR